MNKKILFFSFMIMIVFGTYFLLQKEKPNPEEIDRADEKKTENIIKIRNVSVQSGDYIKSPLVITGEARGIWYFEASFPIDLKDGNGFIIAQSHAEAQGEWMTENFVPFVAKIEFTKPKDKNTGTLILKKDNPSGLSEYDESFEIPIFYE